MFYDELESTNDLAARVEDMCSTTTTTTKQQQHNICGVSVQYARVCVCVCVCVRVHESTVSPQACIKTPSTIFHTSCLSVFCAALSAPRPACLSHRARSLQNDILPAKINTFPQ